ncbi:MAG: G3E family GTPase [Rubritalea sp.]|jgi:G3E family GTPase
MKSSSQIGIAALPQVVKVRPMLMFTGFLGAGKTTLLRDVLDCLNSKKLLADVILNDRENAHIDKITLQDRAAEVTALTGSCVCCDGFHDLVKMIMQASISSHDVLLIELNGTADPVPLQESFTLLESKFCLRPRWQVCVIDARHFRKRRKFNDLESLQLETASHYYISWSDELTHEEEFLIEYGIKEINSKASRTTAVELTEALSQAISKNSGYTLGLPKSEKPLQSPLNFGLTPPKKHTHNERHRLAHEFTGCQIIIPKPTTQERVVSWLDKLPASIIRAKALLTLEEDLNKIHLYQRVGLFTSPAPISAQIKTDRPCSGIFIGADIDPEEILSITKDYLHPDCHFPELEEQPAKAQSSV